MRVVKPTHAVPRIGERRLVKDGRGFFVCFRPILLSCIIVNLFGALLHKSVALRLSVIMALADDLFGAGTVSDVSPFIDGVSPAFAVGLVARL